MREKAVVVLVAVALCCGLASCHREPKPDHKGVFAINGDKVIELKPVTLETDFTDEGFAVRYFAVEPTVAVKGAGSYFILYGNYSPIDLLAFKRNGERYEQDTSKGDLRATLKSGGMSGEPEMHKVTLTKPLGFGNFVLEVEQGGQTIDYVFRVE